MQYMTTKSISEIKPFKCQLCEQEEYKNANGIVRHILNIHKEIGIEEYYMNYIHMEHFLLIAGNKIKKSSLPLEQRLTNICYECKKPNCKLQSFGKGFSVFCSEQCSNKNIEQKKIKFEKTNKALKEKYGVDNPSKIKGFAQKVKKTKLLKYGNEKYSNKEKSIKTIKEKYGDNFVSYTQTKDYKEKVKETSLIKYGTEHFAQSKVVKDKIINTNLEKYGVECVLQMPEIREKIKQTNVEKYGTSTILNIKNIRDKSLEIKKNNFIKKLINTNFEHVQTLNPEKNLFSCKICNRSFKQKNVCLTNGSTYFPRCIHCFPIKSSRNSILQQEFESFLKNNKIIYEKNNRKILNNNKEIDFLIKTKFNEEIGIELNGLYYHSENNGLKNKIYHLNKTKEAENKNVRLIHVFSDEWDHKKEIVKSKLLHIFGENKNEKIFGRKTIIKQISNKEKNDFLIKNHIQGSERSSNIKLGAYYENRLIAIMTFGKLRLNLGNKQAISDHYELLRYASDISLNCVGVSSKLLKYFIINYKPKKIITYADRRWSTNLKENLYIKLGFKLTSISKPNYWYLSPKTEYKLRENRFKYRKHCLLNIFKIYNKTNLFDNTKSEWINIQKLGYDRIWDCGNFKYELET